MESSHHDQQCSIQLDYICFYQNLLSRHLRTYNPKTYSQIYLKDVSADIRICLIEVSNDKDPNNQSYCYINTDYSDVNITSGLPIASLQHYIFLIKQIAFLLQNTKIKCQDQPYFNIKQFTAQSISTLSCIFACTSVPDNNRAVLYFKRCLFLWINIIGILNFRLRKTRISFLVSQIVQLLSLCQTVLFGYNGQLFPCWLTFFVKNWSYGLIRINTTHLLLFYQTIKPITFERAQNKITKITQASISKLIKFEISLFIKIIQRYFVININIFTMKQQPSNAKFLQEHSISALGFSAKADYCVIATKTDHKARIYRIKNLNNINSWTQLQQIKDHTQTISDVDWANDNKIVTSSHDRSVYVWRQVSETKWQKMLVNIDIKLSILVSKWAPNSRKFAMGSSCNTLAFGFYNTTEQCWTVATRNTIVKSPITTLCFHPSSNLLALGSAQFQIKIVTSNFRNSKDEMIIKSNIQENSYTGPFQKIDSLFEVLYSIDSLGGWINFVSFQNNGNSLLVIPHTNHIKIYDIAENQKVVVGEQDIRWNGLPFLSGFINADKDLIMGGFNKKVAKFAKKGQYAFEKYLTQNEKTGTQSKIGLVANLTKGIQKRQTIFAKGPIESEHVNSINVIKINGMPVSYDVNGVVHFWNEK